MTDIINTDQAAIWNGSQGEAWARHYDFFDRSLAPYQAVIDEMSMIVDGETILDVGCGNGFTSREAARQTPAGSVVGVDLSVPMLERARELSEAQGLTNVSYLEADAQVHLFDESHFDLALSRFGSMFFADKEAAFRNIFRAVRSGGRLLFVTWQPMAFNDQFRLVNRAHSLGAEPIEPPPGSPTPFGISDPELGSRWLTSAGFNEINFESVKRPFTYGSSADEAMDIALSRGFDSDLEGADQITALKMLRDVMDEHETSDGVIFDSAVWLITARRP